MEQLHGEATEHMELRSTINSIGIHVQLSTIEPSLAKMTVGQAAGQSGHRPATHATTNGRCRAGHAASHIMREVVRVISTKGSPTGKEWRAQQSRQAGVGRHRASHGRTRRGPKRLAAVGVAGTAAVLLVPAAASADPVGSGGEPPAIVQPAPADQGVQNPTVPVSPGARFPSVTGLSNATGVVVTGCAFDACLQGGGWANGARIVGAGVGTPGVQIAPQFGSQPQDSSWGVVGSLQSPLSAIPGMGGSLKFKYDTSTGLQWEFSSSANNNGGAIGQTYVPGQGWVWNDPKSASSYGAGVATSILGYRIIGPDKTMGPYPTGDGTMSYPPGYQLPPAPLNNYQWVDSFGPNERAQNTAPSSSGGTLGDTFDERWGALTQALPGGTSQTLLDTLRQTLRGPAPAGIPQDTWDSAARALQSNQPGADRAPTDNPAQPPTTQQPDGSQPPAGDAAQPGDNSGTGQSPGSGTADQPSTDQPATDQPSTDQPATDQPSTDQPATDQPATGQPATDQPSTDQPATGQPSTDQPATDQAAPPADTNPAAAPPAADQSVPSDSSSDAGQQSSAPDTQPAPVTAPADAGSGPPDIAPPAAPPPPDLDPVPVPSTGDNGSSGGTGDVGDTGGSSGADGGVTDVPPDGGVDSGIDSGGGADAGGGDGGGGGGDG
jgi:hypothetical protein